MGRALLVIDGDQNRRKAVDWIGKAPFGTRVEFKASKRTLPQNDLLWALLTEVSQQLELGGKKYEPAQWKAIFLHAFGREVSFLPSLDQKTFLPIELSSSDLSKDEMTDFIEFILKEAAERGVVFNDPRQHETAGSDNSGDNPPARSPEDELEAPPPASGSSTHTDAEWLKTAARMLWAATNTNGNTDANLGVLNAQRLAVGDLVTADITQGAKDKAGSIYKTCKQVVMHETKPEIALEIICRHAGIETKEIGGEA